MDIDNGIYWKIIKIGDDNAGGDNRVWMNITVTE